MYAWVALSVAYLCDSHPVPSSVLLPSPRALLLILAVAHHRRLSLSLCRRLQRPRPTSSPWSLSSTDHPRRPSPLSWGLAVASYRKQKTSERAPLIARARCDSEWRPSASSSPSLSTPVYTPFECSPRVTLRIAAFLGPLLYSHVAFLFSTFALTPFSPCFYLRLYLFLAFSFLQ